MPETFLKLNGARHYLLILCAAAFVAVSLVGSIFYFFSNSGSKDQSFTIDKARPENIASPSPAIQNSPAGYISGLPCQNYARRPLAVMIAEDQAARPLSGISLADLVVEMPVVTGGITRMMAVYQCNDPEEIGSVRSARHDFITLAAGLDAVFVHWGGSHFALDTLKRGVIDHLDALPNPFNAFYRKQNVPAPHNGFTSVPKLLGAAKNLGYRLTAEFSGYQHSEDQKSKILSSSAATSSEMSAGVLEANKKQKPALEIGYIYPYNIKYEYDFEHNDYLRWRGGTKEIDRLTGQQARVVNIVIMRAKSRQIEGQYNDVDVEGQGEAIYYFNGGEKKGYWQKDKSDIKSKLYFYDDNDQELKFAPGNIWIEIVEPYQKITYEF